MGKKKEEKQLELKNDTHIIYSGNVKLDIRDKHNRPIKTVVHHNLGTPYLFKFLLNCLIGTYNDSERPRYFYLLTKTEDGYNFINQAGVPADITKVVKEDDGENYYVSYQVAIPVYQDSVLDGLLVYSYNNNILVDTTLPVDQNEYYSLEVLFDSGTQLMAETNLIVTWQLTLQDKGSEE